MSGKTEKRLRLENQALRAENAGLHIAAAAARHDSAVLLSRIAWSSVLRGQAWHSALTLQWRYAAEFFRLSHRLKVP